MGAEESMKKLLLARWAKPDHLCGKCCFSHTTNVSCSVLKDNVSFFILGHCHGLLSREQGENKAKKIKEIC